MSRRMYIINTQRRPSNALPLGARRGFYAAGQPHGTAGTRLPGRPSLNYSGLEQRGAVTEPPVVLRARRLGWSREAAAITLVVRSDVTPFRRLP